MINNGEGCEVSAGRFTVTGRSPPTTSGLFAANEGVLAVAIVSVSARVKVRPKLLLLNIFEYPMDFFGNLF
jgi:hypothetical protein